MAEKTKTIKQKLNKTTFLSQFRKSFIELFSYIRKEKLSRLALIILCVLLVVVFFTYVIEKNTAMYATDFDKTLLQRIVTSVYYGFTTLTTVGYGDYSPKTIPGRFLAIFLQVFGVVSMSMMTATIASIFVERKLKEGRGLTELSHIKNHFVICGWKKDMALFLEEILQRNKGLKSGFIVLVANIDSDIITVLKQQHPNCKDINFIRGEHFNENILQLANVKTARSIFILADESTQASASEIDSKTIMTAMTIKSLVKTVHVCAELLDVKFEPYLKKAHVQEITYPTEYGRMVLTNSTVSLGIAQVINELLNISTPTKMSTKSFPVEYVGKKFEELKKFYSDTQNAIIIGLLENVGSFFERKQEAIREAQKTPDISKLLENMRSVKTMKNNNPNLNPPNEYIIPRNSMAIVIETIGN